MREDLRPRHGRHHAVAAGAGRHRLHAAALRPVRRPHRAGEPRSLCRPAGRAGIGASRALCRTDAHGRAGAVHQTPGGTAFRRHETETRPGLRTGAAAGAAAARRADGRRGPAVAARTVGHRLPAGARAGHQRAAQHRLSGRSGALRRSRAAARRPPAGTGHARRVARNHARPHLRNRGGRHGEARAAGQPGAGAGRAGRLDPGRPYPRGDGRYCAARSRYVAARCERHRDDAGVAAFRGQLRRVAQGKIRQEYSFPDAPG